MYAVAAACDVALPAFDAPDVCLLNFYEAVGRMGLHRDDSEGEAALACAEINH